MTVFPAVRALSLRTRLSLLIVTAALYLLACTFPYDFDPSRNRYRIDQEGTLCFEEGIARTPDPPEWLVEAINAGSLRIAIEVSTADAGQSGPARILTISRTPYLRNLMIAQEFSDLVLRLRRPGSDLNGKPEFVIPGVFATSDWRRIELMIDEQQLRIDLDGENKLQQALGPQPLVGWDRDYKLALGNEMCGERVWKGCLRQASIQVPVGGLEHDVLRSAALPFWLWRFCQMPSPYEWLPRFEPFWLRTVDPWDLTANLLGFVPLGLLAFVFLGDIFSTRSAWLFCVLVSLLIEAAQIFVVVRTPQITDLVCNSAGGLAGFMLARAALGPWRRPQPEP